MKLIHIFFVAGLLAVAFLSVSAPAALADGTDPIVFTKGCGGVGQPACKTVLLTPGETTVTVSETFNCTGTTTDTCSAIEDVINESGATVTSFDLAFNPVSVNNIPLSFSCAPPPTEGSFLFTCNSLGGNIFAFTGGSLCSDSDDLVDGVFTPDGDECGVIIGLQGIAGEPFLQGVTVKSTFSTPEPSSAVLLLFGLMAGLVGFKSVRNILA